MRLESILTFGCGEFLVGVALFGNGTVGAHCARTIEQILSALDALEAESCSTVEKLRSAERIGDTVCSANLDFSALLHAEGT